MASLNIPGGSSDDLPERERAATRDDIYCRIIGYAIIYSPTTEGQEMIATKVIKAKQDFNDIENIYKAWGDLAECLGTMLVRRCRTSQTDWHSGCIVVTRDPIY